MTKLTATAADKDAGRKIKYFARGDMKVSYRQYCEAKAKDAICANGLPVHANYILQAGDIVTVDLPEALPGKIVTAEAGDVNVVYEDQDILIIDKPAPLPCQCTPKQPCGTLENRLQYRYGERFVFRPLNRLDRGTSGLMAAAKHAHACQLLQRDLHTPRFIREYLAVVEGTMSGDGLIDLPIAKEDAATVRRVVDNLNGQPARTWYRVIDSTSTVSLVRLRLETGRTHQILVHLAAVGHPVVGDFLYGHETSALPGRFALHSTHIELNRPCTGERIVIDSPLPEELERLLHS